VKNSNNKENQNETGKWFVISSISNLRFFNFMCSKCIDIYYENTSLSQILLLLCILFMHETL